MRKLAATLLFCGFLFAVHTAGAKVTGRVNDDGFITITAEGEEFAGLDFLSAGGHFIPIPDPDGSGPLSPDTGPFGFLLSNTKEQVTFGKLGSFITIDGEWLTGIGFDGQADPLQDISAEWGGRTGDPVGFAIVPEPGSALLVILGGLTMLCLRRRSRGTVG